MHSHHYRDRLQAIEQELSARLERSMATARQPGDGSPHDAGDESLADEMKAGQFSEAEADSIVLAHVRAALRRIDDGTFGACVVDGEPIEEARLEAVSWTPYCLKHQQLREDAGPQRTPTL